jgi:hypothetical protein
MEVMLFDGSRAELPVARLRPRTSQARHHVLRGCLQQWLAHHWRWLRPRAVPMIVAFLGMLGVLGATKYLPVYASVEQPVERVWRCVHEPAAAGDGAHRGGSVGSTHLAAARPQPGNTTAFHP